MDSSMLYILDLRLQMRRKWNNEIFIHIKWIQLSPGINTVINCEAADMLFMTDSESILKIL